jgi:DNA helicase-2/ATP-dependent DNA helicase PcrA
MEKYKTITEVMQVSASVAELITKLQTLFSDDNKGIVLSSIHKFKGLEAQRVFWYRRDLCPHPKAKSDEDLEQEIHMMYVAGTRSLNEMYFVKGWE